VASQNTVFKASDAEICVPVTKLITNDRISQIRVVDISNRVTKNIGSVPATRMAKIDVAIKNSLGL
jgi:mRNA-degrading endonuclease toxin of MazEF toxin-antitoxin module